MSTEAKVQCAGLRSANLSLRCLFYVSEKKGKPSKVGGGVPEPAVK